MSLIAQDVSISFGTRDVVQHISFAAQPGEVLALLGPNGSGKTTLLRALAGVQRHRGTCHYHGQSDARQAIGYMPQDCGGGGTLSVLELLLLARSKGRTVTTRAVDFELIARTLDQLKLSHLAERRLGELSGGQRQIVFLAQTLVREPFYLLLDEPLSALDLRYQLHVMDAITRLTRELAMTTLIVLHDLDIASRFADRIILLSHGQQIADGPPATTLTRDLIARVFGVETESLTTTDGKRVTALCHTLADSDQHHTQPSSL